MSCSDKIKGLTLARSLCCVLGQDTTDVYTRTVPLYTQPRSINEYLVDLLENYPDNVLVAICYRNKMALKCTYCVQDSLTNIYCSLNCSCFQRIRSTVDEKEQKQLLMDLDVVMRSSACEYIVKFYGALFTEVITNKQYSFEFFVFNPQGSVQTLPTKFAVHNKFILTK